MRGFLAALIGVEREALVTGRGNVGDVYLAALCGAAQPLLNCHLLHRRKLLPAGNPQHPVEVHRRRHAHDRLDARIVGRHMQYMTTAQARPHTPNRSPSISGCSDSQVKALR